MKYNFIIFTFSSLLLAFTGCKDEVPVTPDCPRCWDRDMICADAECDCPEESIETWLELRTSFISNELEARKFCIMPSSKTFVAYVEPFVCIDTFGLTFVEEPWTASPNEVGVPTGTSLVSEIPDDAEYSLTRQVLYIPPMTPDSLKEIHIHLLQPTRGELGESVCRDWTEDGNIAGYTRMIYKGLMVHPDTIKGRIEFMGNASGGTLSYLADEVIEPVDLIRTIPYEE
ncbi:MAG: hypothetical protein ACE362_23930 [Phaeodactylibacter xiamenensis]|uniref:Uncharacterized protein n=1 Tax=Phaeodactylibacter xiamenensis TaxID=1524460 RepID=A0A098S781_9BACT|nr:hypothetical protein [Phaeodactylibacter xiamenensis]KGE87513.1 hypothetical protein IX84_15000 [Phaeodactylibacter xiamenensis]MCR9054898.1 hypothetical protein [bacterium]